MKNSYDTVIVGSGVNGISAAIYLQQKGLKTLIVEQSQTPGGSTKTEELTLPGFKHDVGSAIHPMAYASPFLETLPLNEHGLEWVFPEIAFSQAFPDGSSINCYKDVEKTAKDLGEDGSEFKDLVEPLVKNWNNVDQDLLGPLGIPEHPFQFLKFGTKALPSATYTSSKYFSNNKSKAFFYGVAAHSCLPLSAPATSSFGLVLMIMALKYNWPFPKGGASKLVEALLSYYKSLGGEIELGKNVTHIKELPQATAYVFDNTPRQLLEIKGTNFGSLYRKRMANYEYGTGVFKMDWALQEPIPWKNEKTRTAGTVHLGFTPQEMEVSEEKVHKGEISSKPYVLVAQHSVFDPTRAPKGKHTAWAYCHVPNGSLKDCTEIIEDQIEKVAPGFKKIILARSTKNTRDLNHFNPNIVGGDINGGKQDLGQLFTRPIVSFSPYSTPDEQVYICSSSTPPGGGVHGMCGYHAARKVIKDHFSEGRE